MTIEATEYPTLEQAREALYQRCEQARAAGKRPVVLVESFPRALAERRLIAQAGAGFGVEITTLAHWVADLWHVHGSGHQLVSAPARTALMAKLLAENSDVLPATPGMVNLLSQAATEALIYRSMPAKLVGNEQFFVKILDYYADGLKERGLLEYCEALDYLTKTASLDIYELIVFDADPGSYSAIETDYLVSYNTQAIQTELHVTQNYPEGQSKELAQLGNTIFCREKDQAAVQATGAVVCALAAGPSAEHKLIVNCIQDALAENSHAHIVVAAKDPAALFTYCLPEFSSQGVHVELEAGVHFAETDAGRALLGLMHLTNGKPLDKLEAADFAFNPFAGIWYGSAFRADQVARGNRLLDASEVLSGLAGNATDALKGLIGLFEEGDFETALKTLEDFAQTSFTHRPAYLAQQLQALALARDAFAAAQEYGAPLDLVLECLASKSMADHRATSGGVQPTHPYVLFTSLENAAQQAPASVDYVIVANLNVDSYPIRTSENALQTLLAKWGKAHSPDPLPKLRHAFLRSILAAKQRVYVERSLNDATANAVQPSALFEELTDCYRAQVGSYADTDKTLHIPQSLRPFALQAGEESLVENAQAIPLENTQTAILPAAGVMGEEAKQLLVLPRDYHGQTFEGTDLSASQIESYLECPYQWFAKRRMHIEGIDEGFGALQRGTFMHHVLQAFYERFIAEVAPKLTLENLDLATAILEEVFVQQAEYDRTQRNPGNRYVPMDAWEAQVHESLLPQLRESLVHEANFLKHFHPQYFEWAYGESQPFEYAGCNLTGRIDRIDVDDAGHAVVVDYKSSLSPDYRLRADDAGSDVGSNAESNAESTPESFVLPRKMQTLIYAKVVRQELGLQLAGALYFNPLTGAVQGAYDSSVLGPADFPTYKNADARANEVPSSGIASFDDLIAQSESAVAARMEDLRAGKIDPAPLSPHVCEYCPVNICSARLAPRKV